jgi:hypothetical protein
MYLMFAFADDSLFCLGREPALVVWCVNDFGEFPSNILIIGETLAGNSSGKASEAGHTGRKVISEITADVLFVCPLLVIHLLYVF